MSSALEKYGEYLNDLDLTDDEKEKLIGSIQNITESLLNKKYMLG